MTHLAHSMPFADLYDGLLDAHAKRLVTRQSGPGGLEIFCYSPSCVFDRAWNDITLSARGLIVSRAEQRIVATPFPKFFNMGEDGATWPNLPFETLTKYDGSLIIVYHHGGAWRAATKGAFNSDQAKWAAQSLGAHDLSPLTVGTTYLAEYVGPGNRIVVRYSNPELVMLGAFAEDGEELSYDAVRETARHLGWRVAERHNYTDVVALMEHARALPQSEEGYVLRFENGLRLKVKGDEYRRIHALVSDLTPLGLWRVMEAGGDLQAVKREIPEEFWTDYDQIVALLDAKVQAMTARVAAAHAVTKEWSDKEVGLKLATFEPEIRPFIFAYRKSGTLLDSRSRASLLRHIRPTGNELEGYMPSYAMNRVADESL